MSIRVLLAALAYIAVAGTSGCQSYKAAPFDSAEFVRAWHARSETPLSQPGFPRAASTLPSDPKVIGLAEAEAYALVYNPSLRIARQKVGVARARVDHAGKWEDPSMSVNVERVLSSTADPWVIGGMLNLTLPISGRLEAEKARSSAEHHAELLRLAGEEFAVRHRVRATWAERYNQTARLALLQELVDRLESINRVISKMAESGTLTRMESRVFQVERATRQAELIAVRTRQSELRIQLLSLLGFAPEARVDFSSDDPVNPGTSLDTDLTAIRNFTVRVATAEYEVAERTLKREIQAQFPDLVIGPGFGTDQGDERVLLGLSLPLPLWNRNQPAIAAAHAQRELTRTQLEAAIEQATTAHATAQVQYVSGTDRRRLYESSIVPAANEQAADASRLAELGEVNAVLLLDAFVRQYEARLALLDAQLAESLAAIRLSELQGETAPNTTQPAKPAKGVK